LKVVRTRRSVRLVDGPDLVSHLRTTPGPTHGFFDLLAACAAAFAPGDSARAPRVLLLGFAAGGILAPLRALGGKHPIHAVDLSLEPAEIFRAVASGWAGDVRLSQAEASAWLRSHRRRWDVIVDDLTVRGTTCAIKPPVSVEVLPALMRDRLGTGGVAVTNVLPVPDLSWEALLDRLTAPHGRALLVHCDEYENRILLAGPGARGARAATLRVQAALRRLGSRQLERFSIRSRRAG